MDVCARSESHDLGGLGGTCRATDGARSTVCDSDPERKLWCVLLKGCQVFSKISIIMTQIRFYAPVQADASQISLICSCTLDQVANYEPLGHLVLFVKLRERFRC